MSISRQIVKKTSPAPAKIAAPKTITLDPKQIRMDGGTQSRAQIDDAVVWSYMEELTDGIKFPPIVVFYDGAEYWLADGFHRVRAHINAGIKKIAADVRQGTQRDAILHSVGANATHGLQRTRADKQRAIETLLKDAEWGKWSDREIARQCNVHHETVAGYREGLSGENRQIDRTVRRGGTTYTMDTSGIGKRDPEPEVQAETDTLLDLEADAAALAAEQAEFDRQREDAQAGFSPEVQALWAAQAAAIVASSEAPAASGLTALEQIAELQQEVSALETELTVAKAEIAKFEEMRVQYEKGGFEAVIAGRDEVIKALETRVYGESRDKAGWMKSAKFWKAEAIKLGYASKDDIDIETGEFVNG